MGIWEWIDWNAEPLTAVIALVATFAAIRYYKQYHEEILQKNTMDLLSKIESDPILHKVQCFLSRYDGDFSNITDTEERNKLKFYVKVMLNYFEDVSYKYNRNLIVREAVDNQCRSFMLNFARVFLKGEKAEGRTPPQPSLFEKDPENEFQGFTELEKLYNLWIEQK
ncbi:MAG: hypothetical protein OXF52_03795 [Candidatus Dadabacteria bacterium]|nr:hypothetical protein [Candidatus Dadabacteria bacterium]